MSTSIALKAAIGVLMVDSIIELSFISSMVAWLHSTASGSFAIISDNGDSYKLRGEPLHLLVDQGHTSNGAAGTAFVLIGLGGILSIWLRSRAGRFGHAVYYSWVVCNILALMLTVGALGYVFSVTNSHRGQVIDQGLARTLDGRAKYQLNSWTPQNWFSALLKLRFADASVRSDVASHYRVMLGWQYNLIPLFLVQLVETVLAVMDCRRWRKEVRYAGVAQGRRVQEKKASV
ncbi:hypothetical protein NKR19_g6957 [Coniochaeta hoffmannii]|uniref:Uncharacterized protein n=1 Tax=Coniochaeta hoffmannii TaxID=91930 RepID=A0AA38VE01_9PEZI|nr:hypothetical protein NKR19_g6957 [Coniochaeta hoffmannii]